MTKNFTDINDLLGSGLPKEAEPIASKFEIKEPSEDGMEEEVRPFVSPRAETIELPPDLKKMGLQAVSDSKFASFKNIKLPLTDEKIVVGKKGPHYILNPLVGRICQLYFSAGSSRTKGSAWESNTSVKTLNGFINL